MLASLAVKDIVLIQKASLAFAPGLNVLTGETGAGKSILLDALGLAVGSRGQGRAALRPGSETGSATAMFDVASHKAARSVLSEAGIECDGEIILRRTVTADGRTRAYINDAPVGVGLAREAGAALVEMHGLADDRGLFDVSTHRVLLDRFGGHQSLADEVASLYAAFAEARERVESVRRTREQALGEIEYLTHAAKELADLAPEAGEEQRLAMERALLMNAGRIAEEVSVAADLVAGEGGAENALGQTLRRLSRLTPEGREAARAAEAALETAFAQVQEGRRELELLLAKLDVEPKKLDEVEERLFAIRAAARKYNVAADALANLRAEFEAKLASLDEGGGGLAKAEQELAAARAVVAMAARRLTTARTKAAAKLESAVAAELTPLKLGQAKFRVSLAPLGDEEFSATGGERVSFEISTIAGAAFGPLTRIASGGELARFALALKVALAGASPPAVLVFDEVDRGVGGAVANAVGERLQRLAQTTQVLLVTHSPQVAARATKHFRIVRSKDATRIDELDDDGRVEEVARMLAGAAVTAEARAAARRLIAEAHEPPPKKRARA
jgi:DNA repair protein RecN (Recombination protein N)